MSKMTLAVVRAFASHRMWPGFSRIRRGAMLVVGFRPCPEGFSPGSPPPPGLKPSKPDLLWLPLQILKRKDVGSNKCG